MSTHSPLSVRPTSRSASPPANNSTTLSYVQTPVLSFDIGNIYILDYTNISSPDPTLKISPDVLKLSTTVDGDHFVGYDLTTSPPDYMTVTSTTITLNLTGSGPFPDRLYYYLETAKGAGGAGYIDITYPVNSGVILLREKLRDRYDTLISGGIVATTEDPSLVFQVPNQSPTSVQLYSPYHGLSTGNTFALVDLAPTFATKSTPAGPATSDTVSVTAQGFNVTLDNDRFNLVVLETGGKETVLTTIQIVNSSATSSNTLQPQDIIKSVLDKLNSATNPVAAWNMVYDSTASTFTFTVTAASGPLLSYGFAFNGYDANHRRSLQFCCRAPRLQPAGSAGCSYCVPDRHERFYRDHHINFSDRPAAGGAAHTHDTHLADRQHIVERSDAAQVVRAPDECRWHCIGQPHRGISESYQRNAFHD